MKRERSMCNICVSQEGPPLSHSQCVSWWGLCVCVGGWILPRDNNKKGVGHEVP